MAFNFEYYTPTRILFGRNTEDQVTDLIKRYGGSRVLLHYGGQSAIKSGLIARVKSALDAAGLFHVELGGVVNLRGKTFCSRRKIFCIGKAIAFGKFFSMWRGYCKGADLMLKSQKVFFSGG